MILVDTGIIIRFLRRREPEVGTLLRRGDMAVAGVVRAEILHGAKDDVHFAELTGSLNSLHQLETPDNIWDRLGDHLYQLRRRGIAVPFPDGLLATLAIHHGCRLWSTDNHFPLIQSFIPALTLFTPALPPIPHKP